MTSELPKGTEPLPANSGKDWSDDENDLLLGTYIEMMRLEHERVHFRKSHLRLEVQDRLQRTKRSVEFKLMNISAVLSELGFAHIPGYARKMNFQNSLFSSIERRLLGNARDLELLENFSPWIDRPGYKKASNIADDLSGLVEAVPLERSASVEQIDGLSRLVRKFDPAERDERNRMLGRQGEQFVYEFERRNMVASGRADLVDEVRWVSRDEGDGHGYDIVSLDPKTEEPKFIEVKATRGSRHVPFFLSRNELEIGERLEGWQIYRVFDVGHQSRLFKLHRPLDACTIMKPETLRVWPHSTPAAICTISTT